MNFFNGYQFTGLASAFFVTLSLLGLLLQVKFIFTRRKLVAAGQLRGEQPTATLSLNRFSASYFGYYTVMVYGLCFAQLNHYLVWPRVVAVAIILIILHAIMRDRKTIMTIAVFCAGAMLLPGAAAIRLFGVGALHSIAQVSHLLIVCATIFFLQGAIHQVIKIRREGRTGGLSLPMHFLFAVKDFFSMLFGFAIGLSAGWPLIMFTGVSLIMQSLIMWHFRWVKHSPTAARRRTITLARDN